MYARVDRLLPGGWPDAETIKATIGVRWTRLRAAERDLDDAARGLDAPGGQRRLADAIFRLEAAWTSIAKSLSGEP